MELNLLVKQSTQGNMSGAKKLAYLFALLSNSIASISTSHHESLCELILGFGFSQHSEVTPNACFQITSLADDPLASFYT